MKLMALLIMFILTGILGFLLYKTVQIGSGSAYAPALALLSGVFLLLLVFYFLKTKQ